MRYVVTILSALLLISCSVKKRTYRDGYYIDWVSKKKSNSSKNSASLQSTPLKTEEPIEIVTVNAQVDPDVSLISKHANLLLNDSCGDLITFKSGDQVTARVTEITEDKIKYKRCDNLDGPVFVVNKSTVATIRYSNGVLEKIETPAEPVYTPKTNSTGNSAFYGRQKVHPYATSALVFLIIGSFLFGLGIIFALIWASRAIKEITADPKKWKGMVLAKTVRAISIALLVLFALIILLIIASV